MLSRVVLYTCEFKNGHLVNPKVVYWVKINRSKYYPPLSPPPPPSPTFAGPVGPPEDRALLDHPEGPEDLAHVVLHLGAAGGEYLAN